VWPLNEPVYPQKNIAFSSDGGVTWGNPVDVLFTVNGTDVIYTMGKWWTCGNSYKLYWSEDGVTWNTTNSLNSPGSNVDGIKNFSLGNDRLFMCTYGLIVSYQTFQLLPNNSLTSTSIFNTTGSNGTISSSEMKLNGIFWKNGYYMVAGFGGGTGSTDADIAINHLWGGGWIYKKIFTGAALDIVHDGSKWIATGEDTDPNKRIQYSEDNGTTWSPYVLPTSDSAANIIYIQHTNDEIGMITTFNEVKNDIIITNEGEGPSEFMRFDESQTELMRFDEGLSEPILIEAPIIPKPLFLRGSVNAIALGTGVNTISCSENNGITLTGLGNGIFSVAGIRVFHNGELWVAVGEGSVNTLAISTDGRNWTGKGKVFNIRGKSVTYDNGMWIAVGEDTVSNKCIAYSTNDGITWNYSNSSVFSSSCNDVVYTDFHGWIAVGTGNVNTLATSSDGISWSGQGLVMTTSINTIAYSNTQGTINIGGNDVDKNRCNLYTNYSSSEYLSNTFVWTQWGNNFQGWTEIERIAEYDEQWILTSDGTTTLSSSTNSIHWTQRAKLSQDIKCKGVFIGYSNWISWGEDTNVKERYKVSNDLGVSWTPINDGVHDSYNDLYCKRSPKKLISIPLTFTSVNSNLNKSWYDQTDSVKFKDNTYYKMTFSGDSTSIALSTSYLKGYINLFKIDYNATTYTQELDISGSGTYYNLGRDVTLNSDGSVFAYSYGSHAEDTATTQISRVVIYSKDANTGLWNTIPDATLKGSDFYEYSDFIPVRKFIEGFGSTLKINSDGKILAVASYKDYDWVGMRIFKKRSGVWLPYYTDVQSTKMITTSTTIINDIDITENGQMVAWTAGDQTFIATIPNSAIYTSVKLAPMSGATAYLDIGQDTTAYDSEYGLHSDWHNSVQPNGRIYSYPTSSDINHTKEFSVQSRNNLSFYTGVPLTDTPLASDNYNQYLSMYVDSNGLVGIGTKSTSHQLDVSGTINASSGIYSSGNIVHTSDDRLKINEKFIDNALETIMKIRPEIYDKLSSIGSTDETIRIESGLIAQDLWYNSPELRHLISLGTKTVGTKTVTEEIKVPLNTLSPNVSKYWDEHGIPYYTMGGQIVSKPDIDNESKFTTILSQYEVPNIVPVEPSDIQDVVLGNDIQEDPDYTALGWGDTPASVNYNGLIPYLVKAMQEQQDIIDKLKTEFDILKNA
jgi:hypothetical protein